MGQGRNLARLYHRLTSDPLFPLLFIQEAVKQYVTAGYAITGTVEDFGLLAGGATLLWVLSDADVNWYETVIGGDDDG